MSIRELLTSSTLPTFHKGHFGWMRMQEIRDTLNPPPLPSWSKAKQDRPMSIADTVDALLSKAGYVRQHTRVSRCDTCGEILDGEYGSNRETGEQVCIGCFKKAQDVLTVIVTLIDSGQKPTEEAIAAIIAETTVDGKGGMLDTIRRRAFEFVNDDQT